MIRPVRFVCDYFFGTETSRWYNNQRVIANEHIPEGEKLRNTLRSLATENTIYIAIGKIVPDLVLAAGVYSYSASHQFPEWIVFGELLRNGATLYNRLNRQAVTINREGHTIEIDKQEPGESEGDSWKEKERSWEDEGEEWKNNFNHYFL